MFTNLARVIKPALVVSPLLFVGSTMAEEVTKIDRFQLWNDCQPVKLEIDYQSAWDQSRAEKVTTAVRSKLRAARIYDTDSPISLYIRDYTVGLTTSGVSFQYEKKLTDPASGESAWMITWSRHYEGALVGTGFIMEWINQLTDEFLDEYLRVNADSCNP